MAFRVRHDPGKLKSKAAPEPLELVRAFVNTRYGTRDWHNEVQAPDQLRGWLVRHGLLDEEAPVTEGDFRRALEARDALRSLLLAHSRAALTAETIDTLNRVSATAPMIVRFGAHGEGRLVPDIAGVDGALARLLGIVVIAMADGTWSRLKACPNCKFAFFDRSKNRSAAWCVMSICGNRINARLYRRRRRRGRRATR